MSQGMSQLERQLLESDSFKSKVTRISLLGDGGVSRVSLVNRVECGKDFELAMRYPNDNFLSLNPKSRSKVISEFEREYSVLIRLSDSDVYICEPQGYKLHEVKINNKGYSVPVMFQDAFNRTGLTFADLIKVHNKLDPRYVINQVYVIAKTLSDLHTIGFNHRDVKPQNIAIGKSGGAILIDYGLANNRGKVDDGGDSCELGFVVGTPTYIDPIIHVSGNYDHSDVFQLSLVLYEGISGIRPFNHAAIDWSSAMKLMVKNLKDKNYPKLSTLISADKELIKGVNKLFSIAFNYHPRKRYTSIDEFTTALFELRQKHVLPFTEQLQPLFKMYGGTVSVE